MEDKTLKVLQLKDFIEDYIKENKVKPNVNQYMENVKHDEGLLLNYLQARKYSVEDAWETLKRYTENKFIKYPTIYQSGDHEIFLRLLRSGVFGALRGSDKFGRRIIFLDTRKWDIKDINLHDFSIAAVIAAECFWKVPEVLENGIIVVENLSGFSKAHAREHDVYHLMRIRNILQSFPISMQKIIFLQVSQVFTLLFSMAKPFFPKKIKNRISIYSSNQTPTELFDIAPSEILPEWMGGTLSIEDAAENESFFQKYLS